MARITEMEYRLKNWARWRLCFGGGVLGYSAVQLGVEPNQQRDPYAAAVVPVNDVEGSETDDAVNKMPGEVKATVHEFYLGRGGMADHLKRLCCAEATLYARLAKADRLLQDHFTVRREKRDAERERLELLRAVPCK